jgi:hypothetical protein
MKVHGKTFDYKILYTNISRLFLLPKPDQRHYFFVISLDSPIKQGQTRYPHLVMQFPKEEHIEVSLNLPEYIFIPSYSIYLSTYSYSYSYSIHHSTYLSTHSYSYSYSIHYSTYLSIYLLYSFYSSLNLPEYTFIIFYSFIPCAIHTHYTY